MVKEKLTLDQLTKLLGNIPKVVDPIIYGGLAYLGLKTFGGLGGALFGPVALKLAMSSNMPAGASGVAGLATLGVAHGLGIDFQGMVEALLDPTQVYVDGELIPKDETIAPSLSEKFPYELKCPEGYKLVKGPSIAVCVKVE